MSAFCQCSDNAKAMAKPGISKVSAKQPHPFQFSPMKKPSPAIQPVPKLPRAILIYIHTHKQPFNGPLSGTAQVSRYHKGKTNLDFTGARDSEWQWHRLGNMQVCTSLQTDYHTSTSLLSFLQAGCPSCRLTNSVKALKAHI